MINFDDVIKEETKEHNSEWPLIPDHPYRILITVGFGPGKKNSLFNLINQINDAKYQFLIKNVRMLQ